MDAVGAVYGSLEGEEGLLGSSFGGVISRDCYVDYGAGGY